MCVFLGARPPIYARVLPCSSIQLPPLTPPPTHTHLVIVRQSEEAFLPPGEPLSLSPPPPEEEAEGAAAPDELDGTAPGPPAPPAPPARPVGGAPEARGKRGVGRAASASARRGGGESAAPAPAPRGRDEEHRVPDNMLVHRFLPAPRDVPRDVFIAAKDAAAVAAASSGTWGDDLSVDLPVLSGEGGTDQLDRGGATAEGTRPPASPTGVLLAPAGITILTTVRAVWGGEPKPSTSDYHHLSLHLDDGPVAALPSPPSPLGSSPLAALHAAERHPQTRWPAARYSRRDLHAPAR